MTIQLKLSLLCIQESSRMQKHVLYLIILDMSAPCEGLVIVKVAYCCHDVTCCREMVPRNHVGLRVG